jgi:hypothetical protein
MTKTQAHNVRPAYIAGMNTAMERAMHRFLCFRFFWRCNQKCRAFEALWRGW